MKWKLIAGVLLLTGIAVLSGCGGGSDSSGSASTTAVISLAVTSSSTPTIGGINIEFYLPAGVSVVTDSSTTTPKTISSTALVTGSALDAVTNKLIVGSYYSDTRLVRIAVSNVDAGFSPGEYARLTCVVAPGVTFGQSEIAALPYSTFQVFDTSSNNITSSSSLTPTFTLK
jgi:hypothetical protein